jgi:hypothetical protein
MSDWFTNCVTTALTVIFSAVIWTVAHKTIADECRKLGAFYVGETVFECKEKGK